MNLHVHTHVPVHRHVSFISFFIYIYMYMASCIFVCIRIVGDPCSTIHLQGRLFSARMSHCVGLLCLASMLSICKVFDHGSKASPANLITSKESTCSWHLIVILNHRAYPGPNASRAITHYCERLGSGEELRRKLPIGAATGSLTDDFPAVGSSPRSPGFFFGVPYKHPVDVGVRLSSLVGSSQSSYRSRKFRKGQDVVNGT